VVWLLQGVLFIGRVTLKSIKLNTNAPPRRFLLPGHNRSHCGDLGCFGERMSEFTEKQLQILWSHDVWTPDGKIDAIKFVKVMCALNETDEKDEMKNFLDWMGIKYSEPSK
jgi:hypothetical protein